MDRLTEPKDFLPSQKWLYLFSAVLIEVDEKTSIVATCEISGIILARYGVHQDSITSVSARRTGEDLGIGD
jgi:hypothetical protein